MRQRAAARGWAQEPALEDPAQRRRTAAHLERRRVAAPPRAPPVRYPMVGSGASKPNCFDNACFSARLLTRDFVGRVHSGVFTFDDKKPRKSRGGARSCRPSARARHCPPSPSFQHPENSRSSQSSRFHQILKFRVWNARTARSRSTSKPRIIRCNAQNSVVDTAGNLVVSEFRSPADEKSRVEPPHRPAATAKLAKLQKIRCPLYRRQI